MILYFISSERNCALLKIPFAKCVTSEAIELTPSCALVQGDPVKKANQILVRFKPDHPVYPSLLFICVPGESRINATASVKKSINVSPSEGSHCHADFIIGNHKKIQRCIIDPGANINSVSYYWITGFQTPEYNYNLECVGQLKLRVAISLKLKHVSF